MATASPTETHEALSRRLIAQAEEELANGDKSRASENAWGAVSHKIKAISERRGWVYENHQQVFGIVWRLVDELGDPRLRDLFSHAHGLYPNYCVDAMPIDELRYEIGKAKDLLAMLNLVE